MVSHGRRVFSKLYKLFIANVSPSEELPFLDRTVQVLKLLEFHLVVVTPKDPSQVLLLVMSNTKLHFLPCSGTISAP